MNKYKNYKIYLKYFEFNVELTFSDPLIDRFIDKFTLNNTILLRNMTSEYQ